MKRRLSVSFGASWIVKAGEVLPQALIPDHEKRALKPDASCIEVNTSTAANPSLRQLVHIRPFSTGVG
jgi:hypothetical protein